MYTVLDLTTQTVASKGILTRTEAIAWAAHCRKETPDHLFRIYYLMIEGE